MNKEIEEWQAKINFRKTVLFASLPLALISVIGYHQLKTEGIIIFIFKLSLIVLGLTCAYIGLIYCKGYREAQEELVKLIRKQKK
jgi:hypothetical protein